jgi:GntR family transcriptional regulator / MocR family aminotransferase
MKRYREIHGRIRFSILDGELVAGDRLPSTRTLAGDLGVARGTVDAAYSLLAAEGLLVSNGRNGTFVSSSAQLLDRSPVTMSAQALAEPQDPEDLRYLFNAPLPLMPGLPSFDQFPRKRWYRVVARAGRQAGVAHLTYPDPLGLPALRQAVASHIAVARGIRCSPEQIVVTAGYLGALALVCRAVLRAGARAWIEAPGYGFTRRTIATVGGEPIPVPVDSHGFNIDLALSTEPQARLCVVAPSNQFPLGCCLSLARRAALLDWAAQSGSWIVEDDYVGEFRYDGRPLPALKSLDKADRVFYIGTFSKTMFPGLRIGYLVVPSSQLPPIRTLVRLDGGRSILEQGALADFMIEGHFARHVRRMRALYASRRSALMAAVSDKFGSRFEIVPTTGGLHIVARAGAHESDVGMEHAAAAAGLRPLALSKMGQGLDCGQGLLLGFANVTADQAASTVERLKAAIGT